MTPASGTLSRRTRLSYAVCWLEEVAMAGVQLAVGDGGHDLYVFAPTLAEGRLMRRLVDLHLYDVLAFLHVREGVRRCAVCRDRLHGAADGDTLCPSCRAGRLTLEGLFWEQYRRFDIPSTCARFN